MTLSSIMSIATSGLQVNQETMRYVSTNITNVNTPDYVRKVVRQEALVAGGQPGGVRIAEVQRSVDVYLEADRLRTISELNRLTEFVNTSVEVQALFGEPNENESLNGRLDELTTGFSQLALEPESNIRRYQALQELETFGNELERVADRIQFIRTNTEQRIMDEVNLANTILQDLDDLNPEISRETALGRDTSALYERQAGLLQDLAEIMDIRTYEKSNNFLVVTTGTGQILLEDTLYQFQYNGTPQVSTGSTFNPIQIFRVNEGNGQLENPSDLEPSITGGTLKGLLDMRDIELPNVAEQLGQLGMVVADSLNKVSNEHTSLPAPNLMLGRETGLLPSDQLNFTGEMVVLVTNANRETQESIRVNFDTGTIDDGNGLPTQFAPRGLGSIEDFIAAFNTESAFATMSFDPVQGRLQVVSDSQDNGVIMSQDTLTQSTATFNFDLATDASPAQFGTGAANTEFTVRIGGDTVVTVAGLQVDNGFPGIRTPRATVADQLNADAGFRNAGLTASWENDSTGGNLIITHVTNEELTDITLSNAGTGYSELPILNDSVSNPSIRGNRGEIMAFEDVTDAEIAAQSGGGTLDFSLTVDGTVVNVAGITAITREELVDVLNGDVNFRAANLTAYFHNNTLYVEHDTDAILSAPSLAGSSTTNAVSASLATLSDGTVQTEGRGFSHFFGMNDLVSTDSLPFRETGILPTEPHRLKGTTLVFDLGATEAAADAEAAAATTFNATVGVAAVSVNVAAATNRESLVALLNADATFQAEGMVASFDGTDLIIESSRAADVTGVSMAGFTTPAPTTSTKHGGQGGAVVLEVRGPNNELPIMVALNFSERAFDFQSNFPGLQHDLTREIQLAGPGYTTMQDIVDELNNTITGMGGFAQFTLDADGQLSYRDTGGIYDGYDVRVLDDATTRGSSSISMTELFGLGKSYTMNGALGLDVNDDITRDPNNMALSGVESYMTEAVAGVIGSTDFLAMNPGSTSGATALEAITREPLRFEAAGDLSATTINMSGYATSIIQQTSLNAAQAEQLGNQRQSVLNELQRRWESVSAVNLDEELANMITFQNSYAASARVITTVSQMFDTLLQI